MSAQGPLANINLFVIVGSGDVPIYEADLSSEYGNRDDSVHLDQFVLHAALDEIDRRNKVRTQDMFLGTVDTFNDFQVSAWSTNNPDVRFLLLFRYTSPCPSVDGQIAYDQTYAIAERHRMFFQEVYFLWCRALLNPLYPMPSPEAQGISRRLQSKGFDLRVKAFAKKLLLW